MIKKVPYLTGLMLLLFAVFLPFTACTKPAKSVDSGTNWVVDKTTYLSRLTIAKDAHVSAPQGQEITLTVNGIETGINPGTYTGDVVLTPTGQNLVEYSFGNVNLVHHFRQALYLNNTDIEAARSVLSAAGKYSLNNGVVTAATITSVGENFNGIYAGSGTHTIKNATVDFTGNGGNDFAGYGAAIMSAGKDTTLILDGARIHTRGAVRTAVVADKGSNLIVKNSDIQAEDGKLPDDYVPNVMPGQMKSAPWMLGIIGNCRATNLLGDDTKATYINSSISAENWGTLSNDISNKTKLTAINSKVAVTGKSGYGAYSLAGATTAFYGSDLNVRDYAVIIDSGGSTVVFGASTPEIVAKLNADLKLGLTPDEIGSLPQRGTTVKSDRFGVMMHASVAMEAPPVSVKVLDDTAFDTGNAVFLVKGVPADITVDGAKGAQLNSRNHVILQLIDSDDPGAVVVNGAMLNQGVYHEPAGAPTRMAGFDTAVPHESDVSATFANITLNGDFYNAYRDGTGTSKLGDSGAGLAAPAVPSGKNLILKFEKAGLTGVISASMGKHAKNEIGAADYMLLGEVTNTPGAAVNNGVILSLTDSTWTINGTSYLTSLTIGDGSTITAPKGSKVVMTVNGATQPIKAGVYKGKIILTVAEI